MLPVLVRVGPVSLYTIFIFSIVATLGFFYIVWRRGRDLHFEETALLDVVMVAFVWALVGARVGYILTYFHEFGFRVFDWLNILTKPGWWLPAGVVVGGVSVYWQAKRRKLDSFLILDVVVPAVALSQAIMALGGFFNGTGYGFTTEWFFGFQFPGLYDKRVPVQLLETFWFTGLFICLWRLEGAYRTFSWYKGSKSEARSGFVTAVYVIGLGLGMWLISLLRPRLATLFGWGVDPWIYFGMFVWGLLLLYWRWGGNMRKSVGKFKDRRRKKERTMETLVLGQNIFD